MAKLKGPLFSLGASQQLGKALVYFPWKGLNVVREYVIPSNPKTTLQKKQRGYLTDVVKRIHLFQASVTDPFGPIDVMAYALWGSTYPTPRTWFNQIVKNWLDQKVASKIPVVYGYGWISPLATSILLRLLPSVESGAFVTADVCWGTSKTALINKKEVTLDQLIATVEIDDMPKNTKIFLQVRPTDPDTMTGSYSGIYYAKTLAA